MTPPERPARSLADDPKFLASLSALDRGVDEDNSELPTQDAPGEPPVTPPVADLAPPVVRPLEPRRSPGGQAGSAPPTRRRPLLELFPVEGPGGGSPLPAPEGPEWPRETAASFPAPSAYELFYGLEERAFGPSSDPKFLYRTASHDRALADLLDAIRRRDGVVLLTGAPGLGKTTLCRALIEQLDRRTIASLVAHPFLSIEELLKTVLVDFGVIAERDLASGHLSGASHVELAGALHHFLCSLAPLGAFAVVIIDEAQTIPVEVLDQIRELSDVERDARLLQVVLVGQPELVSTLTHAECEPLARNIGTRADLAPLTRADLDGYVSHRLAIAGTRARVSFDDEARDRLHVLSGGVPGTLNQLCDRALENGHELSARIIDRAIVDRAGVALGLSGERAIPSVSRKVALAGGLVLLALLGAALAALLFRARLESLLN